MTLCIERGMALAVRQGRLQRRTGGIRGIVLHTTGAGPWLRWKRDPELHASPYDAARYIYERISPYSGHYLVDGDTGGVTRLVDVEYRAWHVGSARAWRYKLPGWSVGKGFGWWNTRFPGCSTPRDLLGGALWREGSANDLCIGIEVSPPKMGPRDPWSPACWRSLRNLIRHLGNEHAIPLDRYHVITHSDAHPLARSTKRGSPWDPAPKQWLIGAAIRALEISPTKSSESLDNRR